MIFIGDCSIRITCCYDITTMVYWFNNKITFKRTWSLSNAVCFKYVKYLTTNTAKVGHVTPSRPL